MGKSLNLVKQIHADVYRALLLIEQNELEGAPLPNLLTLSGLAGELAAALEARLGNVAPESDPASEAHTARNEGRLPAD